ncbi:MAG: polysaccharide lyase family 8 super-sandwich domain-containing protein [Balneolales bacterium]
MISRNIFCFKAICLILLFPIGSLANGETDLELIRELVIADLVEGGIDEEEVTGLMQSLQEDGTWPDIDYIDVSRNAFEHSRHLNNMLVLSRAYRKPDSRHYEDPELKRKMASALDYWLEHDFICENWWWNQMGTPGRMVDVLLMMDDALTETQKELAGPIVGRANFEASGARPGGDLIQIAGIYGKYGLFARDEEKVEEAIQAMAGEVGFAVDRGDPSDVRGLQKDFSFHHRHHRVPFNLTYGMGYARSFTEWASKVSGTRFSFPDEAVTLLVDFFLDGIVKSAAWGKYPDPGALSREVGRRTILNPYSPDMPEQLLEVTSHRKEELENIAGIRRGDRQPDLTGNMFFWHSEYFSHQRPGYFTSVRMYSTRNNNLDGPHNSEGLLNHHLADGSNFLIRTGDEYTQIFPVWDWQKIPGTTVIQKPSLPGRDQISVRGITGFVGGVTNGLHGAAVFDFESPIDPLRARKSWFFFDEEFVALGAGIRSGSVFPVATTLNQSLLNGEVRVGRRDGSHIAANGEHSLTGISWVHHDRTAYLFPDPAAVQLENRQRSGSWERINDSVWAWDLDEEFKDVFTLWLDHGRRPLQAGYAYIVVPGIEAPGVEAYRASSAVEILSNTPKIQAVGHRGLELTQIAFYEPGELDLSPGLSVSAGSPGLVMIKTSGQDIEEITVSDPSRELDTFRVKVTTGGHAEDIEFELPSGDYAGQSVTEKVTVN